MNEEYKALFRSVIQFVASSSGGDGDAVIKVRDGEHFKDVCNSFLEIAKEFSPAHKTIKNGVLVVHDLNNCNCNFYNSNGTEFNITLCDEEGYTITTNLDYIDAYNPDIEVIVW